MTAETTIVTSIAELRATLDAERAAGRSVGFVPTMGYLHDGHGSLIEAAAAANDVTFVSIFVNPLQFAPGEDLEAYPRDLEADAALSVAAGAALIFAPSVEEMYPEPILTSVHVNTVSDPLEGRHRPTHFDGVSTVVSKLFAIAGPCRAYFGEKDWQQLAIVRRMASDLSFPVEVVGCPIVREPDGLAMSSRNVYLTSEERTQALVLNQALRHGIELIEAGERDPDIVERVVSAMIETQPAAEIDYVGVVDAMTLLEPAPLAGEVRLLTATRFGKARLLDNMGVVVPD
ncbi:MAG: pantoate--beta-alanine ligase [Acidimicrobiales bacterium]|nr:pantoate--beta-alanine ligase [Acidimicrobiales bacterium]